MTKSTGTASNPFPVEAVATTSIRGTPDHRETSAYTKAWPLVEAFIEDFPVAAARSHLTLGVRGAFGSGKTHLLLQLIDAFTAGAGSFRIVTTGGTSRAIAFYVKGDRLDLLDLYANRIVRHLELDDFRTIISGQLAGLLRSRRVALESRQNESPSLMEVVSTEIDQQLETKPHLILALLENSLLPITDLAEIAETDLRESASDFSESFMRAYAHLTDKTLGPLALKWIKGQTLTSGETKDLGLTVGSIESADHARTALKLLLSLLGKADVRLLLCLDEFERAVLAGSEAERRAAAAFVKDVAEIFIDAKQCVVFCGADDGWNAMTPDVFDRIRDVVTVRMTREEVTDILRAYCRAASLDPASLFRTDALKLISEIAGRSPRRLLTLAHYAMANMQRREAGTVSLDDVTQASERALEVGRRRSAVFQVVSATARKHGFGVEPDAAINDARCDLLLSKGSNQIAIFILSSVFKLEELDEARSIADRSRHVMRDRPRIQTAVVVTGYSTREVRQTLDQLIDRVFWYEEGVFADSFAEFLAQEAKPVDRDVQIQLEAQQTAYQELERRFRGLQVERQAEVQRLGSLLETMQTEMRQSREVTRERRAGDKIEETIAALRSALDREKTIGAYGGSSFAELLETQRALAHRLAILNEHLPNQALFARILERLTFTIDHPGSIDERRDMLGHLETIHLARRQTGWVGVSANVVRFSRRHWASLIAAVLIAANVGIAADEMLQVRRERAAVLANLTVLQRVADRIRRVAPTRDEGAAIRVDILQPLAEVSDVSSDTLLARVGAPSLPLAMADVLEALDAFARELDIWARDEVPGSFDLTAATEPAVSSIRRARPIVADVDGSRVVLTFPVRHPFALSIAVTMALLAAALGWWVARRRHLAIRYAARS